MRRSPLNKHWWEKLVAQGRGTGPGLTRAQCATLPPTHGVWLIAGGGGGRDGRGRRVRRGQIHFVRPAAAAEHTWAGDEPAAVANAVTSTEAWSLKPFRR